VIFKGKYEHTVDAKGRLFVPVKYREGLGDTFVICQAFFQNCLWAFSSQDFDEMAEKMDFSLLDEQAQGVERVFYSSACDVEVDKAGRILLPQSLRDYAGLGKDVVITGSRNRIEIWDKAAYDNQCETDIANFRGTLKTLREQGVRL
jgi:MraZ protein